MAKNKDKTLEFCKNCAYDNITVFYSRNGRKNLARHNYSTSKYNRFMRLYGDKPHLYKEVYYIDTLSQENQHEEIPLMWELTCHHGDDVVYFTKWFNGEVIKRGQISIDVFYRFRSLLLKGASYWTHRTIFPNPNATYVSSTYYGLV